MPFTLLIFVAEIENNYTVHYDTHSGIGNKIYPEKISKLIKKLENNNMSFFFWLKIKIKRTESNENTLTILAFYFLLIMTYNNWLAKKTKMRWTYSKIFLK